MINPNVSIIIPCLNEQETLALCIQEATASLHNADLTGEIIVSDNGSSDGSQEIAMAHGARVVTVTERGYGAALHGGILAAKGDVIVFGDADMSYPFSDIKKMVDPILSGQAEFVLGSRLLGQIDQGAMPLLNRYVGTPILTFLIKMIYGLPVSDCNSGMRAFLKSVYPKMSLRCPGMEYASEMLIQVALQGIGYAEVPIRFRVDRRSRSPHLRRWRDGWRHLRFIIGNAPSLSLIIFPGIIGYLLLCAAFVLSFGQVFNANSEIHFHTALSLIALGMPFLLLTNTFILVKTAASEAKIKTSRLVTVMQSFSENTVFFYLAVFFYALAAAVLTKINVLVSNKNGIPSAIRDKAV